VNSRPDAPATGRNKDAILEVLQFELRDRKTVFEIGSGTGQHAVQFAAAMPWLEWQTADLSGNHPGILAWVEWANLPNLRAPLIFDATRPPPVANGVDAVFSANTAHIMSMSEVESMFDYVSCLLNPGGVFCLYGPFNENGQFTSDSNEVFDASLRAQSPSMGIRDRLVLEKLAGRLGLSAVRRYSMPANNQILVWEKPFTPLSLED
jgi:cyclopropane fatty-acyl-phospholipid synthase-like methyltransferase